MAENNETINSAAEAIKSAILQSQYRTGRMANAEMLSLYFGVGKYVSENSREGTWGTGAIEAISKKLQRNMPGLKGFSARSIKNMRQFYETWAPVINSAAVAAELPEISKSPAVANDLPDVINTELLYSKKNIGSQVAFEEFISVSFSNHIEILNKTKTLEERSFYIHQIFLNKWDKYSLRDYLKQDLFHHQGKFPNNFSNTIKDSTFALKAINTFKDNYLLDYINTEELGVRDIANIDERVLEKEIIHNIKNFLMTFGRDFAFVGDQYHLEVCGVDHFTDLLFFNRELNCLVVVELKKGEFKSAYLGQLCTYLRLVDDQLKKPHENPAIGIILCQEANKDYVEYVIQDYNKPMGVATYTVSADMPEKLRNALPDIEEMRKLLSRADKIGDAK